MPPSIPSGGASNPNQRPAGVNGTTTATASATRDDATSAGCGRSFQGRPLVRMMKMTRICVAIDSRNHVVLNSGGRARVDYQCRIQMPTMPETPKQLAHMPSHAVGLANLEVNMPLIA